MAPPLLHLRNITLTFGGAPLLDDVELAVSPGERACLVGRNGSGKSTLLRIAAGLIEPDRGTRFVQPGATVRYLPQEPDLSGHATTLSYVQAGLAPGDDPHQAKYLLEQLGLGGEEDPAQLSGGEARRAALARVLAPAPDILLLDEPTNHLDLTTIEWLERELAQRRSALVLISHDRRFLQTLSRATVWLDRGSARRIELGFGEFEAWRDERLAEEELEQHKLDRKIEAEQHWLRYGVTARPAEAAAGPTRLPRQRRQGHHRGRAGRAVGRAGDRSGADQQGVRRPQDRRGLFHSRHARRPHRHRRPERQRQDHARQPADRRSPA
jgi:ATP-binding cassette subfamily F protein uup